MSKNSNFSIAIVGGGLGGLFAALCIHHHCNKSSPASNPVHIDIYEQASQYKEIGAGIGIGLNAVRLVDQLGLLDELYAVSGTPKGTPQGPGFKRFDHGKDIFRWPMPKPGRLRMIALSRSALLDVLLGAIKQRGAAKLHTEKACQKVEDNGDKVTLRFADGTSSQADLVVACDGIHSAIRAQFVSDQSIYSGQIAYRDVIPMSSITHWPYQSFAHMWLGQHKHFFVYPISRGEELNIIAFVNKPETEADRVKESWTTTCERADVQEDFKEHEETVQMIIQLMHDKPSRWRINDREPLNTWHYMKGKVVLLGDAAHAMTPHLGAGGGQSMEDGWVLGRAVSDYLRRSEDQGSQLPTLETVASVYQSARLPRAQKAQTGSRVVGNTYDCQTEDLINLTFDECCPIVAERITEAMKWTWEEDLDICYEKAREDSSVTKLNSSL